MSLNPGEGPQGHHPEPPVYGEGQEVIRLPNGQQKNLSWGKPINIPSASAAQMLWLSLHVSSALCLQFQQRPS